MAFQVKAISAADKAWLYQQLIHDWGSEMVVSRGVVHHAGNLAGFIAFIDDNPVGSITYDIVEGHCEIVTINATIAGQGIGSQLIEVVKAMAIEENCHRLWLITTNDNIDAIRFYQKRGFAMVAVHRNAILESRKLKPSIPEIGNYNIPIRDEIEFEISLNEA